jgi:hypothetical protein
MELAVELGKRVNFKIFIKCQIYYNVSDQDDDSINAIYAQTLYDVITGKYNLTEQDVIALASIQILAQFGGNKDKANQELSNNIDNYIPSNRRSTNHAVYWQQKIMELYSKFDVLPSIEAKLNYLDHLKENPLWNAQQFEIKVYNSNPVS